MNPNWCEISLAAEQEQELRGRLQFRRNSRSVSESESVCSKGDRMTKQVDESECEEGKFSEVHQPATDSVAYQFGMKFVYGAAKVVSTMADGGKENRDLIKKLRGALDQSRKKCDELETQVENSKQWIAYYENLNEGLENQIEEVKQQLLSNDCVSVQEKLKRAEIEADCCRKELNEVTKEKDTVVRDMEAAKSTAEKLKQQVEEAQKKIAEVQENIPATLFNPTMVTVATQIECDERLDVDSSLNKDISEKLKIKEDQLQDATRALQFSLSQGDKLRHRLMTSLKSMKSQTCEMRLVRVALDSAVKKTNELNTLLDKETLKLKESESTLLQEKELQAALLLNLKDTEQRLDDAQSELKQEKSLAVTKLNSLENALCELKFDYFAETLVSDAISSAVRMHHRRLFGKQVKILQDDSNELSKRLQATKNVAEQWKEQFLSLEIDLQNKESYILEHAKQVENLEAKVSNLKREIESKKGLENKMKTALSASEIKLAQAEVKYQEGLSDKNQVISRLNDLIQQLKNENSHLQYRFQQRSIKPNCVSAATQTHLQGYGIDQLSIQKANTEKANKLLTQQIENANHQAVLKEQENFNQKSLLAKFKNEIALLTQENDHLRSCLQANQLALDSKRQHLWQADQECKRLYWECQQQNWRSVQLYNENTKLRNYFEAYFANSRATTTSKIGYNATSVSSPRRECQFPQQNTQVDSTNVNSASGVPLETIKEKDERLSATSSVASMEIKPEAPSSPCSITCSVPVFKNKEYLHKSRLSSDDLSTSSQTASNHSELLSQKNCANIFQKRPTTFETETLTSKSDDQSTADLSINDDVFYLSPALQQKERLVGIPMPETIYDRIVAGEDIPSWNQDQVCSQDDGYSTSSYNSIKDELHRHHFQVVDCADSVISEYTHSDLVREENEQDLHFLVNYRGVPFDMVNLSLPNIRNIASSSGAIASQEGMNNFYDFLANKIEEMNQNPHLKNSHKLGSPTDWLCLKQET